MLRESFDKFLNCYLGKELFKQKNPFGKELEHNSLKYEKPVQEYVLNVIGDLHICQLYRSVPIFSVATEYPPCAPS